MGEGMIGLHSWTAFAADLLQEIGILQDAVVYQRFDFTACVM